MKWHYIALVLLLPYICISCKNSAEAEGIEVNTFEVDYGTDYLWASAFLHDYKAIQLESPSNDAIVNHVGRLFFTDSTILVLDDVGNKILAFDNHGKFLNSTAKMLGKGRDEYIRIIDAGLDVEEKKLYVHCDAPYQMMIFDANLNLERTVSMDYYMRELVTDGNFIYGLRRISGEKTGYEIIAANKSELQKPPTVVYVHHDGIAGRLAMGKSLTAGEDCVYASLPFDNKICKLKDGAVIEEFLLDFGDKGLTEHPISKNITTKEFDAQYNDINWDIVNMCSSDSLLLFNTNMHTRYVIDIPSKRCNGYNSIINDILSLSGSTIIPAQGLKHRIVFETETEIISNVLKLPEDQLEHISPEELELARNYKEDGNPLIVIWAFK